MITFINSLDEIEKTGNVCVVVKNGERAPCKKIVNTIRNLSERMTSFKFYVIELTDELKDEFRFPGMPCMMKVVDGVYGRKLCGHFWGEYEIEAFLLEN